MKLSNEQLNSIMAKADNDLDMLKDRCHDLYSENLVLKKKCNMYEMRMYEEENAKNKYMATLDNAIKFIEQNYFITGRIKELYDLLEGAKK